MAGWSGACANAATAFEKATNQEAGVRISPGAPSNQKVSARKIGEAHEVRECHEVGLAQALSLQQLSLRKTS